MNILAFEHLIAVNEACPESEFNLSYYRNSMFGICGTTYCFAGNYARNRLELWSSSCQINEVLMRQELGITRFEFEWLFLFGVYSYKTDRTVSITSRKHTSYSEGLVRLKKFYYYKRKKMEVSLEQGRYISGNQAAVHASLCVSS